MYKAEMFIFVDETGTDARDKISALLRTGSGIKTVNSSNSTIVALECLGSEYIIYLNIISSHAHFRSHVTSFQFKGRKNGNR